MEVVAQEKSTNKPNTGLTDQLHKDITSSAKISQMETKLFDFYSSNNNICITQTTIGIHSVAFHNTVRVRLC